MKSILQGVLAEIKPSAAEEKKVKQSMAELLSIIKSTLPAGTVELGGSGQKGTWLKNTNEFDIFVKFPQSYKNKNISDILEKSLKKKFRVKRVHGSRDYFQFIWKKCLIEVIPILTISKPDNALNITDISPFHALWVKKHGKYADDIRLTKQFCRAARVYGAESYIQGFSGYICEILSIHYKGFGNLLKAVAKWKPKVIIDTKKYHRDALFALDKAKTIGPLVIIDPVQSGRNAAAAVSLEKFNKLIAAVKLFSKKPKVESFFPGSLEIATKKAHDLVKLEVIAQVGKKDIIGCRLLKCFEYIRIALSDHDFVVSSCDWEWRDKAYFYYQIKKEKMSSTVEIRGPPVKFKAHAKAFSKKHKQVFVRGGYLVAKQKRSYLTASQLIKKILRDKYIKERVKSMKLV